MNIQPMQRAGWYQFCDYDNHFEFNPLATPSQAVNEHWHIRQPLAYVSRSSYVPTLGLFRVLLWENPSLPNPRLESIDSAFDFVEHQTGHFVTREIQTCPTCGQILLNLHFFAGRPKSYCSDACKMKAYRQRHRHVNTLALRNSLASPKQFSWMDI